MTGQAAAPVHVPTTSTTEPPPRVGGWSIPSLRPDGRPIDEPIALHPTWGHPLMRVLLFLLVAAPIGGLGLGLAYLVDPSGPEDGASMLITALGLILAAAVGYLVMAMVAAGRSARRAGTRSQPCKRGERARPRRRPPSSGDGQAR